MLVNNSISMYTHRQLNINSQNKIGIMEKLSSGYRINKSADDAAGLAISEKMNARMRALRRCENNIQEGISLCQVADGALEEVNHMLSRVNELCVQAANGTNKSEDRTKIAEEIKEIYAEMDRVFTDTEFNKIKVFRYAGVDNSDGLNASSYTETVTMLPTGQFKEWGEMLEITGEKEFELAELAKGASVTLMLDDDVDLNDAMTLEGKSFDVEYSSLDYSNSKDKVTYEFSTTKSGCVVGYDALAAKQNMICYIKINTNETVQDAFNKLCNASLHGDIKRPLEKAEVFQIDGNNQVTIDFATQRLEQEFIIDGNLLSYPIVGGNGVFTNGFSVSSDEERILNEVDSLHDNSTVYSKDIVISISAYKKLNNNTLTIERKEAIKDNALELCINGKCMEVSLTESDINSINTVDDLNEKIKERIKEKLELEQYTFTIDIVDSKINLRINNCVSESQEDSVAYVRQVIKKKKTTTPISINVTQIETATMEKAEKWRIEFPDGIDINNGSFALNVNGSNIFFHDYNKVQAYIKGTSYIMSENEDSIEKVAKAIDSCFSNATCTVSGNSILIEGHKFNENLNVSITGNSIEYEASGILYSNTNNYFNQDYSFEIDLNESCGINFSPEKLYGKGFSINGNLYEFSNSTNELTNENTRRIDISTCSNYDDIANVLQNEFSSGRRTYNVINTAGVLKIIGNKVMTTALGNSYGMYSSPYLEDGYAGVDGLFNNTKGTISVIATGGTNVTQPYTTIDFSSYMDDPSSYYGTGFRVVCATCPGEFFNVIFCHDKDTFEYAESFEYTDTSQNPPVTNTIHNYFVELKDVESAEQIVEQIVTQLKPNMDHYIDVEANGSSLVLKDIRSGNLLDSNGVINRAKVISGVYTNFTYDVDKNKVLTVYDLVSGSMKDMNAFWSCAMIYSSDIGEDNYIPIHLPNFSVKNLKLKQLNVKDDDIENITEVMKRAKTAAEVVSIARGKIGADQNRLEHANGYTSNAEVQMTENYSRIKDMDMAEGILENAKLSILADVSQAIMAQVTSEKEQILRLLQ